MQMNPFTKINSFLGTIFSDLTLTAATIFGIGFLICGLFVWQGSEEQVPKFKKGLIWTAAGFTVSLLAKVIITWMQTGLK